MSMVAQGKNILPQLYWENVPEVTQSFAVTMYDKDAPTGSGFWHWVVFNIPANVKELKSGAGDITKNLMPEGAILSNTDGGSVRRKGRCHEKPMLVFKIFNSNSFLFFET